MLEASELRMSYGANEVALAPGVLRRMARRESGSAMQARRQRALQRGT